MSNDNDNSGGPPRVPFIDLSKEKKKQSMNPYKRYREYKIKKRLERERILFRREQVMKEDTERYLMELEDRHVWISHQLAHENYQRMLGREVIAKAARKLAKKEAEEKYEELREDGLSFFKGNVQSYRRWQNSAAKHMDFKGHTGAVFSCKLSRDYQHVLSCSDDKTAKLWVVQTGECVRTFEGHKKGVTDCDLHHSFSPNNKSACIITCSGDTTLRLWSGRYHHAVTVIKGHTQAIYKCSFSPDGNSFVSCSEDKTIRTWCFPEGYQLFCFRGHTSPISSINYSPTGRYLISGSDYGERKILLWDAQQPVMADAKQFPHMIFWTPDGLIKKILIRTQQIPKPAFWLAKEELGIVENDDDLDFWDGELDPDIHMDSESEEEDDPDDDSETREKKKEAREEKKKAIEDEKLKLSNAHAIDDVREIDGCSINVTTIDKDGEQVAANDYRPGEVLYIGIQSLDKPVAECFIDVVVKDKAYDMFSPASGMRVGEFDPAAYLPWATVFEAESVKDAADSSGKDGSAVVSSDGMDKLQQQDEEGGDGDKANVVASSTRSVAIDSSLRSEGSSSTTFIKRPKFRDVPVGLHTAVHRQALRYDEKERFEHENKDEILYTEFESQWNCPAPELGVIVVNVNFKFRRSTTWKRLSYSLKESPFRAERYKVNEKDALSLNDAGEYFPFDQEDRHRIFWEYLRDKKWESVAAFIDKKCVLYHGSIQHKRRWRAMNFLAEVFDSSDWIIVHSPLLFKAGQTKSVALCDTDYAEDDDEDDEDDEEWSEEDGDWSDEEEDWEDGEEEEQYDENGQLILSEDEKALQEYREGPKDVEEVITHRADGTIVHSNLDTIMEEGEEGTTARTSNRTNAAAAAAATVDDADEVGDGELRESSVKSNIGFNSASTKAQIALAEKNAILNSRKSDGVVDGDGAVAMIAESNKRTSATALNTVDSSEKQEGDNWIPGLASMKRRRLARYRLQTRPLGLPHVVPVGDVGGPQFDNVRRILVKKEVNIVMRALDDLYYGGNISNINDSMVRQIRSYCLSPNILHQLQHLRYDEVPIWVHDAIEAVSDRTMDQEIGSIMDRIRSAWKEEERIKALTNPKPQEFPLIKSGKYGPDIEEFSMPLPTIFPHLAGKSANALAPNLELHEKVMVKLRNTSLPTTLDEVRVVTMKEKLSAAYVKFTKKQQKLDKAALQKALEPEVALHMLTEQCYVSGRRPTYCGGTLPGMEQHNPSLLCTAGAVLLADVPFQKEKTKPSLMDFVFGRALTKSNAALPVGRRPTAARLFQYKNALAAKEAAMIRARPSTAQMEADRLAAAKPEEEKSPEVLALLEQVERAAAALAELGGEAESHKTLTELSEVAPPLDKAKSSMSLGGSIAAGGKKGDNNDNDNDREGADGGAAAGGGDGDNIQLYDESLVDPADALLLAPTPHPRSFPEDVFLERRTTYPVAPGLFEFFNDIADPQMPLAGDDRGVSAAAKAEAKEQEYIASYAAKAAAATGGGGGTGGGDTSGSAAKVDVVITSGKKLTRAEIMKQKHEAAVAAAQKEENDRINQAMKEQWNKSVQLIQSTKHSLKRTKKTATVEAAMAAAKAVNLDEQALLHPSAARAALEAHKAAAAVSMKQQALTFEKGLIRRFTVSGQEIVHHGSVNDVVFAPSETRVASAGGDKLIKIWDPRDGSFVRALRGHSDEVMSVQYSGTEEFLVSAGADSEILIWSMLTLNVVRRLMGHVDVIYNLSISSDVSVILSASHDSTLKSWYTTPRHPDAPLQPRVISVTDTTAMVTWQAPPSFNLEVTAFHMQYRIGLREAWKPPETGFSIAPQFRSRLVKNLIAATPYQFRIRAENMMGLSPWSEPSRVSKLLYGIPEQLPRSRIVSVYARSLSIFWFAPNPDVYGSASTEFDIQCEGNGRTFEDHPNLCITMEEGRKFGDLLIECFKMKAKQLFATRHILVSAKRKEVIESTDELIYDSDWPVIADSLSMEHMADIVNTLKTDRTVVLLGCEYKDLRPGFLYSLRTRGINVAGKGPWSQPSLSTYTLPVPPLTPVPPKIVSASLREIEFGWTPPDDGGTAMTGYKVLLQTTGKIIELSRSSVTYKWQGLYPGKSYRIKVRAFNKVGESPWSEWNDISESYTLTAAPEVSANALAVDGNWNTLVMQGQVPYSNGNAVTSMEVQVRVVEPFQIGEWVKAPVKHRYDIPEDVEITEHVDLIQQQLDTEKMVMELETLKASLGFNPYSKESKKVEKEINHILSASKPPGSKFRFTIEGLNPDTIYEVRMAFINFTGQGDFSHPSHRAKTNSAAVPSQCEIPEIFYSTDQVPPPVQEIGKPAPPPPEDLIINEEMVTLRFLPPFPGGSPIRYYIIELVNLNDNSQRVEYISAPDPNEGGGGGGEENHKETEKDAEVNSVAAVLEGVNADETPRTPPAEPITVRIEKLVFGMSYMFRVRAESLVGPGLFSEWTSEFKLNFTSARPYGNNNINNSVRGRGSSTDAAYTSPSSLASTSAHDLELASVVSNSSSSMATMAIDDGMMSMNMPPSAASSMMMMHEGIAAGGGGRVGRNVGGERRNSSNSTSLGGGDNMDTASLASGVSSLDMGGASQASAPSMRGLSSVRLPSAIPDEPSSLQAGRELTGARQPRSVKFDESTAGGSAGDGGGSVASALTGALSKGATSSSGGDDMKINIPPAPNYKS